MHLTAHAQRRAVASRGCYGASSASPAIRPRGATRGTRYARDHADAASSSRPSATSAKNPLEQLRSVSDPQARARIMQELDGSWSTWSEHYTPSAQELVVTEELGVWDYNVVRRRERRCTRVA